MPKHQTRIDRPSEIAGLLGMDNSDAGTVLLDGTTLTLTSDGAGRCPAGIAQVWEQVKRSGDTLRGVVTDRTCPSADPGEHPGPGSRRELAPPLSINQPVVTPPPTTRTKPREKS